MSRSAVFSAVILAALLALAGCQKNTPQPEALWAVDDHCPGPPHCTGNGDNQLHVGVASRPITPALGETQWTDDDADGEFDPGEAFVDENGNGEFDAIWIAGFGNSRPATGVNDDLEVRALALQRNDVTVVIAYLDLVGYFADQIEQILARPEVAALDVDHFIIGSTHSHQAADSVGLWGRTELDNGFDPDFESRIRERTAEALVEAVGALQPATMEYGQVQVVDPDGTTLAYNNDVRDPIIYDPTLTVVRFAPTSDSSTTIATLLNWSAHPEYGGDENNLLSADYVHWLRDGVENGVRGLPGVGGTAVFVQGPLGGQIGPGGGVTPLDSTGQPVTAKDLTRAQAAGESVAVFALELLDGGLVEAADTEIQYRTAQIFARLDNTLLQLALLQGIVNRKGYRYDESAQITEDNTPYARTRSTYLQVGPVAMITAPGELHPELWVGGYDGSWSWGHDIIEETVNTPDLATAPSPPYLRDLVLDNPGVEIGFCAGLANDFLGYIVPAFDYMLDEELPYFDEPEGDHYEETYSLGPQVEEHIQHPMMELAKWRK